MSFLREDKDRKLNGEAGEGPQASRIAGED